MAMPDFIPEGGQRDSAGDAGFEDFVPEPKPVYVPLVEEKPVVEDKSDEVVEEKPVEKEVGKARANPKK